MKLHIGPKQIVLLSLVLSFVTVTPALSASRVVLSAKDSGHVYEGEQLDFGTPIGITGRVVKVIDGQSLLLTGAGSKETLVVIPDNQGFSESTLRNISLNNKVHIEGRAADLNPSLLKSKYDLSLSNRVYDTFDGNAVIVAETVDLE